MSEYTGFVDDTIHRVTKDKQRLHLAMLIIEGVVTSEEGCSRLSEWGTAQIREAVGKVVDIERNGVVVKL